MILLKSVLETFKRAAQNTRPGNSNCVMGVVLIPKFGTALNVTPINFAEFSKAVSEYFPIVSLIFANISAPYS